MRLTYEERMWFSGLTEPYRNHEMVLKMKEFIQHGSVSTYSHCMDVAKHCFWLNRRFHLHADEKALVIGSLLHDFYLYDWHDKDCPRHNLHGFFHPGVACENAIRIFEVGENEQGIIRSHMWPLTFFCIPKTREAWMVCLMDKYCSTVETLFKRNRDKVRKE